jgi:hypothetical protein
MASFSSIFFIFARTVVDLEARVFLEERGADGCPARVGNGLRRFRVRPLQDGLRKG